MSVRLYGSCLRETSNIINIFDVMKNITFHGTLEEAVLQDLDRKFNPIKSV